MSSQEENIQGRIIFMVERVVRWNINLGEYIKVAYVSKRSCMLISQAMRSSSEMVDAGDGGQQGREES